MYPSCARRSCHPQSYQTSKNARRDVEEHTDETVLFVGLWEDFMRTCAIDQQSESCGDPSFGTLTRWIKNMLSGLFEILKKVEALIPDLRYQHSIQDTLIAHWRKN